MTPSELQDPSAPVGASQMVCGGPPAMSTFFSFPAAMNATKRLSGDQNGRNAPSVPGSGRASIDIERADPDHAPAVGVAGKDNVAAVRRHDRRACVLDRWPASAAESERSAPVRAPDASRRRQSRWPPAPPVRRRPTPTLSRTRRRPLTTAGSPTLEPPLATHCNSADTSRAVCQRSSGSLARQRDTIRSSAGGVIGTSSSIGRGVGGEDRCHHARRRSCPRTRDGP